MIGYTRDGNWISQVVKGKVIKNNRWRTLREKIMKVRQIGGLNFPSHFGVATNLEYYERNLCAAFRLRCKHWLIQASEESQNFPQQAKF